MKLLYFFFKKPFKLNPDQRSFWDENGYIVLRKFFKRSLIEAYLAEVDRLWEQRRREDNPLVIDFWSGDLSGKRMYFREAPDGSRHNICKLNDVHFVSEYCRKLCLNQNLSEALSEFLGSKPLAVTSITFEQGSEQEDHFDTYYSPAPAEGPLAISSIFLEDVGLEQGPVRVYPKSHLVPPYRFSDNSIHLVNKENEKPLAREYILKEMAERGIEEYPVTGDIGDVLIWDGQMYHGGKKILDPTSTRKSLVTFYWGSNAVEPEQIGEYKDGANYLIRDHQAVPQ